MIVWVRKDLVRDRNFSVTDCYPVSRSDRLIDKPIRICFSRDIWGRTHQRETYAEIVKRMADERRRWAWQPERPIQRPPTPHALPSVILLRDARINSSSNPALLLSKVLRVDPTRPYILFTFENHLFMM